MKDNEVQGVAIYLEFRKPNATYQVVLTPDGINSQTEITYANYFSRSITYGVSKRKWRTRRLKPTHNEIIDALGSIAPLSIPDVITENDSIDRLTSNGMARNFTYLAEHGYKLVKDTPIYVEVTKDDLTHIRQGNLPTKLWTRIKAVRKVLDFPEAVVN